LPFPTRRSSDLPGLGQGDQAVGADVMGDLEAFAGGDFGEVAVELIAGGEAHRMDDAVQAIPLLRQCFKDTDDLRIVGDIAREAQLGVGAPALGEFLDATLELVVLVGEGEFGALAMHGSGNARSDGEFTGDAYDQYALSCEKSHVVLPLLINRWLPEP